MPETETALDWVGKGLFHTQILHYLYKIIAKEAAIRLTALDSLNTSGVYTITLVLLTLHEVALILQHIVLFAGTGRACTIYAQSEPSATPYVSTYHSSFLPNGLSTCQSTQEVPYLSVSECCPNRKKASRQCSRRDGYRLHANTRS